MKTISLFFATAIMATLFAACSVFHPISRADVMSIQEGMTRQELIKKLGTPSLRSFGDGYEVLDFNAGYISSSDFMTVLRIRLQDDKVVDMESIPVRPAPTHMK